MNDGHRVVLRPSESRYQLVQPPRVQTVFRIDELGIPVPAGHEIGPKREFFPIPAGMERPE